MDLLSLLPDELLPSQSFANLIPSFEKHEITVADIVASDAYDIARRARVPPKEVERLSAAIVTALHKQLGLDPGVTSTRHCNGLELSSTWKTISTLDDALDAALGGGFPTGYVTEVTGESGTGKTQLLFTLLLAVQFAPPVGLGRSALYISSEAPLQTNRLSQLLEKHPHICSLEATATPSLSRIFSISISDLETQDQILHFQVPIAMKAHNVGLVIIDSVTANYRAENDGSRSGAAMARRSAQLLDLGAHLRELAREEDAAIVIANQVADRFTSDEGLGQPTPGPDGELYMSLDEQQQWFTGWGDAFEDNMKTPSLGLVWTNQVGCRIALKKRPRVGTAHGASQWHRYLKLVFAPWVAGADGHDGIEFDIGDFGIRAKVDVPS